MNTVENIDEVEQIILLTTCTTKLHRYYRVTLHFLNFYQNFFLKIQLSPSINPQPFYYLRKSLGNFDKILKIMTFLL